MKTTLPNLRYPAILSAVLVLPFVILELLNRPGYQEGFPLPLFGILGLLPAVFIRILTPTLAGIRAREPATLNSIKLWLRVSLLILIAWLWVAIILDQMPCFLGVPNCD